jgi:hypothetical protein
VKDAIRAGGIRDMPYEKQVLVARALIILKNWPDELPGRFYDPVRELEWDRHGGD